ncbi:MAG: hypothetical protein EAX96_01805 [Candidatus Lokiarchaeota archaeon]|nr:hypothetical protein [Candidatus Lokiarchaeota archaeon]
MRKKHGKEVLNVVDFKETFSKNLFYFIGIILIGILCILFLILQPHAPAPEILDPTKGNFYNLVTFGLGLDTTVLILTIASYLIYRWEVGGRSNTSLLIWGICFFFYSITFVAHIFRGLGFPLANENYSPFIFFLWRFGMILWAAGSLYGILRIFVENKRIQIILPMVVIGIGFAWFIYGLFIVADIEFMMYGFLFTIWIPICFSISYIFFMYGRKSGYTGPKLLFLGYLGLTITYMGWAPWHFADVIYFYFVWYFLFLLSLVPILIGFMLLSKESEG